jgi:hypothetical protein
MSETAARKAIATALALFLPAPDMRVDVVKVLLAGIAVTGFFLFTAPYYYPGGAHHFTSWAEALVHGTKLSPHFAQRDIGFPLLLLLGGYTVNGSFIGITLIHAVFAILMPVLLYLAICRLSQPVALLTAACAIASFAPIYYMKWIHHDQTYIFFTVLTAALLALYLQTHQIRYLYFFTAAAIATSLSRPAGNILFPIFLGLAYLTARGRILHYMICAAIFCGVTAGYLWHRYEIFDMAHQPNVPSYTGEQIFYNAYINSIPFGVHISPAMGPNLAKIGQCIHDELQPSVRDSAMVKAIGEAPSKQFMDEYFYKYTSDELERRVFEAPNREYLQLVCAPEKNDQIILKAALEVLEAHPWYFFAYTGRNLWHLLARPGFSYSRYDALPFHQLGKIFPAGGGEINWTDGLPLIAARAAREVTFLPLSVERGFFTRSLDDIQQLWGEYYQTVVVVTLVLMIAGWLGLLARFTLFFRPASPRTATLRAMLVSDGLASSIVAASLLLLYNFVVTAAFVDPDYRYHNFMVLIRLLVSGYGLIVVIRVFNAAFGRRLAGTAPVRVIADGLAVIQRDDAFAQVVGSHFVTSLIAMAAATAALFALWARFMVLHTS